MSTTQRILITGATGFLGRNALAAFENAGWDVIATGRSPGTGGSMGSERALSSVHAMDIMDLGSVQSLLADTKPSHLLHLAWRPVRGDIFSSQENFVWCDASIALARLFWEGGGRRFIGCGTCVEYPDLDRPLREGDATPTPQTPYGEAKARLNVALEQFAREHDHSFVWSRVFHAYGPWEGPQRLTQDVIAKIRSGSGAKTTHGEQFRDFVYAGDVARVFLELALGEVQGAVNVGSGRIQKIRDIAKEIARQLERPELLELGALPAREGEPAMIVPDISRLRREVGVFHSTGIEKGIAQTIAWHMRAYPTVGEPLLA